MHWLQTLDTSLFRFINGSLSNPLFDAVMLWVSGNRLFAPLVMLAAAILLVETGRFLVLTSASLRLGKYVWNMIRASGRLFVNTKN